MGETTMGSIQVASDDEHGVTRFCNVCCRLDRTNCKHEKRGGKNNLNKKEVIK